MKKPSNIPASVRARLLNLARKQGRPFNEVLQYFAIERFLYRLSMSRHSERFVLKGALMLQCWGEPLIRSTRDIDLLGSADNSVETLIGIFRNVVGWICQRTESVSIPIAFREKKSPCKRNTRECESGCWPTWIRRVYRCRLILVLGT